MKSGLHTQIELEVDKGGEAVQSFPFRKIERWVEKMGGLHVQRELEVGEVSVRGEM